MKWALPEVRWGGEISCGCIKSLAGGGGAREDLLCGLTLDVEVLDKRTLPLSSANIQEATENLCVYLANGGGLLLGVLLFWFVFVLPDCLCFEVFLMHFCQSCVCLLFY